MERIGVFERGFVIRNAVVSRGNTAAPRIGMPVFARSGVDTPHVCGTDLGVDTQPGKDLYRYPVGLLFLFRIRALTQGTHPGTGGGDLPRLPVVATEHRSILSPLHVVETITRFARLWSILQLCWKFYFSDDLFISRSSLGK